MISYQESRVLLARIADVYTQLQEAGHAVNDGDLGKTAAHLEAVKNLASDLQSEDWLEVGVNRELQRLEYSTEGSDGPSQLFPEILLALAPLYMNEVLTEESFLRDELHFNRDDFQALEDLVELGEIKTQRTQDGFVFYGLHHSTQAEAYWNYGTIYRNRRNMPEYEDFIYRYASFGPPNGIEAIHKIGKDELRRIVKRLDTNDKLLSLIKNSRTPLLIIDIFISLKNAEVVAKPKIIEVLAHHIKNSNHLLLSGIAIGLFREFFNTTGKELWRQCKNNLADRLSQSADLLEASNFIRTVCLNFPDIEKDLCD